MPTVGQGLEGHPAAMCHLQLFVLAGDQPTKQLQLSAVPQCAAGIQVPLRAFRKIACCVMHCSPLQLELEPSLRQCSRGACTYLLVGLPRVVEI